MLDVTSLVCTVYMKKNHIGTEAIEESENHFLLHWYEKNIVKAPFVKK